MKKNTLQLVTHKYKGQLQTIKNYYKSKNLQT